MYSYGYELRTTCRRFVSVLYEREFMLSLAKQYQADVTSAFNDTSRYLDGTFNIDN